MTIVSAYSGPQCPRCKTTLAADAIGSGAITCTHCNRAFEATAFEPPQHQQKVTAQVVTVGPDGANACANHSRNAATASCQRCGLFICGLCDMDVGAGSYCPTCFERVRTEGTLQTTSRRYRDYARIALTATILGLFFSWFPFFGLPVGPVALYYSFKAGKQRRGEGRSRVGVTFLLLLALLETLASVTWTGFMIVSLFRTAT